MRLVIFSHKPCWPCATSPTGYATDGGFPFQMKALSELFDTAVLLVPCLAANPAAAETPLTGNHLAIVPLSWPPGKGVGRKLLFPFWLLRNSPEILSHLWKADAVHAPIPGDVGTIGMLGAVLLRKPLFVRYCGNWLKPRTRAEKFWHWFMERFAGGRNVMLATGGATAPPSDRNPQVRWIFSTSLTEQDLSEYAACRRGAKPHWGRLITVARQEQGKRTDLVIKSLALLKQEFPEVRLEVVGDGTELESLAALASSLGLRDRVVFHGKTNHRRVMELLQSADIFCFPSASEGFPKAVLEALACGLPVVASPVSVLPLLLKDGAGVLISEPTPEAVAFAVQSVLSSPEKYAAHSARALAVASGFSLEHWQREIAAALQIAWGQPLKTDSLALKTSAVPLVCP
jgi:glycosyltransferase involved in cell wall biosynthesis